MAWPSAGEASLDESELDAVTDGTIMALTPAGDSLPDSGVFESGPPSPQATGASAAAPTLICLRNLRDRGVAARVLSCMIDEFPWNLHFDPESLPRIKWLVCLFQFLASSRSLTCSRQPRFPPKRCSALRDQTSMCDLLPFKTCSGSRCDICLRLRESFRDVIVIL
jgi:hypothetical protein